jgi:hypothetical protein
MSDYLLAHIREPRGMKLNTGKICYNLLIHSHFLTVEQKRRTFYLETFIFLYASKAKLVEYLSNQKVFPRNVTVIREAENKSPKSLTIL